ncbi:histidine kinase [Nonlabens sp. MB-3u-79]|uniref:histidine kinase n=1 Tax=Nonlabens sp. MB-3u-79 TaxID=2058134 RepID=UPI000C313DD7|nr:histidine kinase [Nonlabens sp. MB-3u-79]AUC80191.1 histidine kinase [Nonlabens sp. MB-3u-79]
MFLKKIFKLIWVSALIALLISVINLVSAGRLNSWPDEIEAYLINYVFSICITTVNFGFFDFLGRFYTWTENGMKRLLLGAIGSVVVTMITLFVVLFSLRVFYFGQTVSAFFEQQKLDWYLFGFTFTMFMSVIFHAFYFYKELQARKVNEQKVIARSATAQFDALKNQLDPHFLFNSLNVLVSLIEENPKAATKFTTSLSKVYRYVLEQRNKELVSVEEELNFARAYVGLLKTRFEDSIEIDIPEKSHIKDAQVVPLSLQLLLENAVKHNIVSDNKPLKLRVYEEGNQLIVENNLQKKQVASSSSGVGLQNIASRYQLLTDRKISIAEDETHFKVQIPILTNVPETVTSNKEEMTAVEDIKLVKAKERVKIIKDYYDDVLRTIGIILFLAAINYFTSDFPWAIFPAIGMSIGLLFKYLRTYEKNAFLGKGWEDRKIDQLMNDKNF